MEVDPGIIKSRAYKVTKAWLDSGKPFDEDEVFARAYLLYQRGKHLRPAHIRRRILESLIYLQNG